MAKLHLFYSVMNAGKTTHLLQAHWNYTYNGGKPLLFTSAIDDRSGVGIISSRIGLKTEAIALRAEDNLFSIVSERSKDQGMPPAVLIDEAQFLTPEQAEQASDLVDFQNIPVMAYGLKNNAFGRLFSPAMERFLALADQINEIKQLCHCGRKATMILRYGPEGDIDRSGEVVEVGGESRYVSVCRYHYKVGDIGKAAKKHIEDRGGDLKVFCCACHQGYKAFTAGQAEGCAADIRGNGIRGHYGSNLIDMETWRFVTDKPAHHGNGTVCDRCLETWITDGSIVRESSHEDFV